MQKKYIIGIGIVIALVLIALFAIGGDTVKAVESYFTRSPEVYVATTTTSYMTAGTATTTYTYSTWNVDQLNVALIFRAASPASALNWKYEYSNNGSDWFGEDQVTVTTNILNAHSSTTPVHSYIPGNISTTTATTTNYKMITFPNAASVWKRIVFSVPAGSAAGAVWAEATLKSNTQ